MKIVLAGSVKFTLTKENEAWKRKKSLGYSSNIFGIMSVAYQYVLLPISTSFFFFIFLTVYLQPVDESIGFRVFYIYIEPIN